MNYRILPALRLLKKRHRPPEVQVDKNRLKIYYAQALTPQSSQVAGSFWPLAIPVVVFMLVAGLTLPSLPEDGFSPRIQSLWIQQVLSQDYLADHGVLK